MNKIRSAILVESKKMFRSRLPFISILALSLLPLAGGLFMFIFKDPSLAENLGFISTKADIMGMGTAEWSSYFALLSQGIAVGGLVVFGFNFSWVFGREYSDRTIKDLLALPISRNTIVLSKFIVISLWCFILSLIVLILALTIGKFLNLLGWSSDLMRHGILLYLFCSILTILLSTPVAIFASVGRGYLSPLGFIVFTIALAQVFAIIGYGEYFPWAIPAIISGADGSGTSMVKAYSIMIVALTSTVGLMGTIFWWKYVDQG